MRLLTIPALVLAGVVLAGCAGRNHNKESTLVQTRQVTYTCLGTRALDVTYDFANHRASVARVQTRKKAYRLTRVEGANKNKTIFSDGVVTWLVSGDMTPTSVSTHQGGRLLKARKKGKPAVLARGCSAS